MGMHGDGTSLQLASGSAFFAVGEIRSIDGPDKTITAANASHLLVRNMLHSYIPGLKDGGELSCTLNFTGAGVPLGRNPTPAARMRNYADLYALWNARAERYWRTVFPDGNFEAFWAFITLLGPAVPEDDTITARLTLKSSGDESVAKLTRAGQITTYSPASGVSAV